MKVFVKFVFSSVIILAVCAAVFLYFFDNSIKCSREDF